MLFLSVDATGYAKEGFLLRGMASRPCGPVLLLKLVQRDVAALEVETGL